jgi:hypothetical protein
MINIKEYKSGNLSVSVKVKSGCKGKKDFGICKKICVFFRYPPLFLTTINSDLMVND